MSLADRLKRIEQRLSALEQVVSGHDEGLASLLDALEQEDVGEDAETGVSLDGDAIGCERDTAIGLD